MAVTPRARTHLHAVDLMRVLTVALVVGVHTVTHSAVSDSLAAGALTIVLHTSREVFFVLTALVLMHGYGRRRVRWLGFWRRRYLCVAVPYLAWTVIYIVADGHAADPLGSLLARLGTDLLFGGAKYQMYFLLVSMQIYLCFPVIRWVIRATAGHHRLLVGACAIFQLGFALAVRLQWSPGGVITAWVHGPDAVLPSYLLYVIAGGVAAWHLEAFTAWTLAHRRHVLGGAALTAAAGVVVFLLERLALGQTTVAASGVFQPVVVLESLAVAWTFFLAGSVWAERGSPARRAVHAVSDATFGVYLAHPLVLMGIYWATAATGLWVGSQRLPAALVLFVAVAVVVPLVYAVAALPALLLRSTPLSLAAGGRPRRRGRTAARGHTTADAVAA
jgi:surface polysaccharide O-acyltransferase-like enzyme